MLFGVGKFLLGSVGPVTAAFRHKRNMVGAQFVRWTTRSMALPNWGAKHGDRLDRVIAQLGDSRFPDRGNCEQMGVACRQCIRWHPDKITGPNDYVAAGPFDLIPSHFLKTMRPALSRGGFSFGSHEVLLISAFLRGFPEGFPLTGQVKTPEFFTLLLPPAKEQT